MSGKFLKITALMSCPRLGFTDNFFCALSAFTPLGIQMAKDSGAYWEQSLSRLFYLRVDAGDDYVITVDYDSVFTQNDVIRLVQLASKHNADAVCAAQLKRDCSQLLMTIHPEELVGDGTQVDLQKDLLRIRTGHFGLTVISCDSLRKLPQPWFFSHPDKNNCRWDGEGKVDADIFFWLLTEKHNWKTYQANDVRIGHIQRVITWPTRTNGTTHQYLDDYEKNGKPAEVRPVPTDSSLDPAGALTPRAAPAGLEAACV